MFLRPVKNIDPHAAHLSENETITGIWAFSSHPTGLDHTQIANIGTNAHSAIDTHIADSSDPHGATLTQTALNVTGNLDVDGTANLDIVVIEDRVTIDVTNSPTGVALILSHIQDVAAALPVGLAFILNTRHTSGTVTQPIGCFGGFTGQSNGVVTQGEAIRGTAKIDNTYTPSVTLLIGVAGSVDVEDATVTAAISIYGTDPEVDTGSLSYGWAGLFEGDVQVNSDKKLLLEGNTLSKGDTYFLYDSAGSTLDCFVNGSQVWNAFSSGFQHVAANLGFYGTAPAAKQTVTGSRGGNAALASLLTALANIGLITDSST